MVVCLSLTHVDIFHSTFIKSLVLKLSCEKWTEDLISREQREKGLYCL